MTVAVVKRSPSRPELRNPIQYPRGYDRTRDPRNTRELEALAFPAARMRQLASSNKSVIDRFIAEKAMLGRPTQYPSGTGVTWSDANLVVPLL